MPAVVNIQDAADVDATNIGDGKVLVFVGETGLHEYQNLPEGASEIGDISGLLDALNAKFDKAGGTITGAVTVNGTGLGTATNLLIMQDNAGAIFGYWRSDGLINTMRLSGSGGTGYLLESNNNRFRLGSSFVVGFASGSAGSTNFDVGLSRNAAGLMETNNGTKGTLADHTLRNLIATGYVRPGAYTVSTLPTPGSAGRMAWASNGRKSGEGAGSGTGVPVYDTGSAWVTDVFNNTAVTA